MKPTDFAHHLTTFLTDYLAGQRQVSPHTIQAYRDVFVLFLRFCRDRYGVEPERLHLAQIDADRIVSFLEYLCMERQASVGTRNHRLAALHAFFRYLQTEEPAMLLPCQRILAIPFQRADADPRRVSLDGGRRRHSASTRPHHTGRATRCSPVESAL